MHDKKGIESLVLEGTTEAALQRFASALKWPPHLAKKYPDPKVNARDALSDYFSWAKGNWGIADFIAQCTEAEIPEWLRDACVRLMQTCDPAPAEDKAAVPAADEPESGAAPDGAD